MKSYHIKSKKSLQIIIKSYIRKEDLSSDKNPFNLSRKKKERRRKPQYNGFHCLVFFFLSFYLTWNISTQSIAIFWSTTFENRFLLCNGKYRSLPFSCCLLLFFFNFCLHNTLRQWESWHYILSEMPNLFFFRQKLTPESEVNLLYVCLKFHVYVWTYNAKKMINTRNYNFEWFLSVIFLKILKAWKIFSFLIFVCLSVYRS